ncbi:MAG: C40 family peptidase [Nitrospiria bacterium]
MVIGGCGDGHNLRDISVLSDDTRQPASPLPQKVIQTAHTLLGTPYRFGGTTPKGFDCSGLVYYVFRHAAGLTLPRTTRQLIHAGRPIRPNRLSPADLVFFKIERQKSLHIGIYIGNGKFIHAPSSGGKVNIQRLTVKYWKRRYLGARRVL